MEQKPNHRDGMEGILPEMAPLANPYVPFQKENPPQYEPGKAFVRGTIYPGLDLPFMGMVNEKEKQDTDLVRLQTLAFMIQELALYLDTHRNDREALALYRRYQRMLADCKQEYEKKHGPLTHMSVSDDEKYDWLDDPWPWEYSKNREV